MDKESFQFKVPIYGVLVKVIKDERKKISESFKNSTGVYKENIMSAMEFAKTIQVDSKTEGSYVVLLLTEYHNASILVHEAVHMAKAIMRVSGIKQPDEETEAYITQYCFNVVDTYYMR
tara:strand:+ start:1104 stop:1460 length:357 start_codon:yes stop_codon:yes gene_type:complete